jgi:prolyl 4-hydroxylase
MWYYFVLAIVVVIIIVFLPKYSRPRVIKSFLSEAECDSIMEMSLNRLTPSGLAGSNEFDNRIRQSDTTFLRKSDLSDVYERTCKITNSSVDTAEDLQVVRYKPNGFYKPHYDACCFGSCSADNENGKRLLTNSQRTKTLLVYLNDDFEGGDTIFPNLNEKYKLKKGDALMFNNLNWFGYCTPLALHGGDTVQSGEKWICNIWLH